MASGRRPRAANFGAPWAWTPRFWPIKAAQPQILDPPDAHPTLNFRQPPVQGEERELLVHYVGWNRRWDEWVRVGAGRFSQLA